MEAAERAQGVRAAAWAEWTERLRDELRDGHPVERVARAMTVLSKDEVKSRDLWTQRELISALGSVLGDLWSRDVMKHPSWDHEQVLEWFLGAVKVSPTPHQILVPRKVPVLGELKAKLVTEPGWTFSSGSTSHILADDWHYPMTVLVDGRRGSYLDRPGQSPDHSGFSGMALREMAKLAHLPEITPRPTVR
jgi:hypothetical protein